MLPPPRPVPLPERLSCLRPAPSTLESDPNSDRGGDTVTSRCRLPRGEGCPCLSRLQWSWRLMGRRDHVSFVLQVWEICPHFSLSARERENLETAAPPPAFPRRQPPAGVSGDPTSRDPLGRAIISQPVVKVRLEPKTDCSVLCLLPQIPSGTRMELPCAADPSPDPWPAQRPSSVPQARG